MRKGAVQQYQNLISMAKQSEKHYSGILAFWKTKITYAIMEGFNNKIGWLTRQAYGYRDEEYLILKIFDLPNLRYRLLACIGGIKHTKPS